MTPTDVAAVQSQNRELERLDNKVNYHLRNSPYVCIKGRIYVDVTKMSENDSVEPIDLRPRCESVAQGRFVDME